MNLQHIGLFISFTPKTLKISFTACLLAGIILTEFTTSLNIDLFEFSSCIIEFYKAFTKASSKTLLFTIHIIVYLP